MINISYIICLVCLFFSGLVPSIFAAWMRVQENEEAISGHYLHDHAEGMDGPSRSEQKCLNKFPIL